ncbi:MAG: phospholipase D-like domain-containing protein [Mycoplasmoidaceae bacterium]
MSRLVKFSLMLFSTCIFITIALLVLIYLNSERSIEIIFWSIFGIYLFQIIVAFAIFSSKRRYEVKASWLFALNIPIIGLLAFLTMGLIPFEIKSINQMKKIKEVISVNEDLTFTKKFILENKSNPMTGAYNIQNAPIYNCNKIRMVDQKDLVEESIKLIRSAKESINIQFYIISDSKWLNLILNELVKKSKEGVKIKIIFDYIGSYKKHGKFFINTLKKHKIEYAVFNSTKWMKIVPHTNFRNHRKGIIVDNKYCLTGGSNLGDEYINLRKDFYYWNDTNFIIEGESVHSLNLQFYYDWYKETTKRKSKNEELIEEISKLKISKAKEENAIIQIIHSEPYSEYKLFQNIIDSYNAKAQKRIWIYTPYFASHMGYINSLILAAMAGIDVRIILPGKPDRNKLIIPVNRSVYNTLISSNVKIYEYEGFTHSKGILIDDHISILGSNNLDMRSLFINFETALIIDSKEVSKKIEKDFIDDMNNSKFIDKFNKNKDLTLIQKIQMKIINVFYGII